MKHRDGLTPMCLSNSLLKLSRCLFHFNTQQYIYSIEFICKRYYHNTVDIYSYNMFLCSIKILKSKWLYGGTVLPNNMHAGRTFWGARQAKFVRRDTISCVILGQLGIGKPTQHRITDDGFNMSLIKNGI